MRNSCLAICCFLTLSLTALADIPQSILDSSVMVKTEHGSGSGVGFKNGPVTMIWTDAHVVASCQTVKTVIDLKTGQPKVVVSYSDAWFGLPIVEDGRKVGEEWRLGRIVRYSAREDIALLVIYQRGWLKSGVKFTPVGHVPKMGSDIWHVGSPRGSRGMCSVTAGVFSFAGRLRKDAIDKDTDGYIYDQVALPGTHGCSGGGMFCKGTSECIGLVTEFLDQPQASPSMLCITPTRRLWDFAKRNDCEWAMNPKCAFPANPGVLTDDELAVPGDFRQPPPPPIGPPPGPAPSPQPSYDFFRFFRQR